MDDYLPNEYGRLPKYEVGDEVRIWTVFGRPTGRIESIVDRDAETIKFLVRYTYHTGDIFYEEFSGDFLTLVERRSDYYCNCATASSEHSTWCNRYRSLRYDYDD